jgi:hypothetical protein
MAYRQPVDKLKLLRRVVVLDLRGCLSFVLTTSSLGPGLSAGSIPGSDAPPGVGQPRKYYQVRLFSEGPLRTDRLQFAEELLHSKALFIHDRGT